MELGREGAVWMLTAVLAGLAGTPDIGPNEPELRPDAGFC